MIEHLDHISRTAAALELMTKKSHRTRVTDNRIFVDTGEVMEHEFLSEEAYMVWMLNRIMLRADTELRWMREHHQLL